MNDSNVPNPVATSPNGLIPKPFPQFGQRGLERLRLGLFSSNVPSALTAAEVGLPGSHAMSGENPRSYRSVSPEFLPFWLRFNKGGSRHQPSSVKQIVAHSVVRTEQLTASGHLADMVN